MKKLTLGLIGYGNVGSGVVKFLNNKKSYMRDRFQVEFSVKSICDLRFKENPPTGLGKISLTTDAKLVLNDPDIDIVVELIGGVHPAREFVSEALKNKKHIVTANKSLIANFGHELFALAQTHNRNIYFESSVMAGVPIIKMITEGVAGNQFNSLYGIINGTCNYILTEMSQRGFTFAEAVKLAQEKGFAEADPTLDINGTDSAHKLAILIYLTMAKFINLKDIHTEGITHISHDDIEYAESLGLTIKLLAIAKRDKNSIEARVHPTLISKSHPLASINGVFNATYLNADPLGTVLLSGEGAGQMAAASGVVSDLINLATCPEEHCGNFLGNIIYEDPGLELKTIDEIQTRFYFRFLAIDKPGVLAQIAGILGEHGISINSLTQKIHNKMTAVPVIMLTDYAEEKMVRLALEKIHKLAIVKSKPVAIRMENLP